MEWDDFRLVKMIAEHRALGPAAEALKLNHSTVFRKLNALEEQLGTRLFERSRSGYTLTVAGEEMLTVASQMAEAVTDFERRIAGMDARPTGELRITTTDTLYSHLLAPIFAAFRAQYPGITLDVIVESRALNLSRRDADVAIRAAADPPETLVGRRIAPIVWAPYALKDQPIDADGQPYDLDIGWIGFADPISGSNAGRWFMGRVPQTRIVLSSSSVAAMAQSVAAGIGAGFLPCFVGDQMPTLKRIGAPVPSIASHLWLLTHADLRGSVRTRAFLDFVGAELARRKKLIEGVR
jgi:DNA-binding transcriptional LysR family regulator